MPDTPLTPSRLEQLQALFEQALERPAAGRAAFLDERAPDDPGLRAEVLALLRAHGRDDAALRSPISSTALAEAAGVADRRIGDRVGAYQIVRLIGVGGMGAVYEAARADDQFRKRVAIKFLDRPATSADAIRRFRAERQILASLNHPGIAALLDGGVAEDGQPYFVMEYIDGEPITAWCDARHLTVRERLGLFQQIAGAVRSAHQALVVHRDLKPGNILVAADGQVKLLDFGIAKLLRPEDEGPQLPDTHAGQRSFTPEYAAPEQFRGLPVGTAADIYALGVILFELLAGRRPFDLQGRLLAEMERIVCEQAPRRASTLIDAARAPLLGEPSASRARAYVAGDLDAIVGVALRKEPERRYGSVDLLAHDVHLYLDGHPVSARPDTLGYRVRKLVRRRKLETGAFAFAAISVATGFAGVTIQANRAEEQRRRAEQVTGFLSTMLGSADPASLGRDVTVREVLDSAAVRADTLRDLPALEAEVRTIIGNTYMALGEFQAGETQFRRALDAHRARVPAGDHAAAQTLTRQSQALEYTGDYAAADSVLQVAAAMLRRFPHRNPLDQAAFLDQRGRILSRLGRNAEAEPVLQEALDLAQRFAGGSDSLLAHAYASLARVKTELGQIAASESLYVAAVAAARRTYGDDHPELAAMIASSESMRGAHLTQAGRFAQAESLLVPSERKLLEIRGNAAPVVRDARARLVALYTAWGKPAEAARWRARIAVVTPPGP